MMKFPDRDSMTPEEVACNIATADSLVKGATYRFDAPVTATAIPTGGHNTCALAECVFERGWYIGFVDGNHVFQGKPIDDQRVIPIPEGYENAPSEILEKLRDSYFHVLFIGGSQAILVD